MADDVAYALLDATRRMSVSGARNIQNSDDSVRKSSLTSNGSGSDFSNDYSSSVGSSGGWIGSWKSGSGGWMDSWKSSASELDDKYGSLPPKENGNWFAQPQKRESGGDSFMVPDIIVETVQDIPPKFKRAFSESAGGGSRVKIGIIGGGGAPGLMGGWFSQIGAVNPRKPEPLGMKKRTRHQSSSKDVEEAMSAGLSKADLYMPPI